MSTSETDSHTEDGDADDDGMDPKVVVGSPDFGAPEVVASTRQLVTSEAALTLPEARTLSGRRGARVALMMGEVGTGKTTLLVETWERLLVEGALGDSSIAGSRTALAFEERAFYARIGSERATPLTPRTAEETDGFLHLRMLRGSGHLVELLLADITGEHFEHIREGIPLEAELPWAERIDRFAVVVDGKALAGPATREVTVTRTQRQLLALRESGLVTPTARVALLLMKADALSSDARDRYERQRPKLLALAREIDSAAVEINTAARPENGSDPIGLDAFMRWLTEDDRAYQSEFEPVPLSTRSFGRFRV